MRRRDRTGLVRRLGVWCIGEQSGRVTGEVEQNVGKGGVGAGRKSRCTVYRLCPGNGSVD